MYFDPKEVVMEQICIIPLATDRKELFLQLQEVLATIFSIKVSIMEKISIPKKSWDQKRGQFNASKMIDILEPKIKRYDYCKYNLFITEMDLYSGDLNFVFGVAKPSSKVSIISLARLITDSEDTFQSRIIKEAVHELGHLFGLPHCTNPKCVMRFSNSLADTDRKGETFCTECKEKLFK